MNADGSGFSGYTLVGAGNTAAPAIAWNPVTNKLQYAILAGTTAWVGSMNYNGTGASQTALAGVVASAPAIAIDNTGKVQFAFEKQHQSDPCR